MEYLGSPDLLYGISGFCVGVLVGMTGVGGGSLMTPLLILVFGVHPTTAVGTDLLFAASTKATGTIVHAAARTVDWMLVFLLAIGSVPATIATLVVLSRFDLKGVVAQHVITVTLGGVLLVTALFLVSGKSIRARYADRLNRLDPHTARLFTISLGVAMGVLVTVTSAGAGAIGVTVLLLLHPKMPSGRIVGSDIAHGVPLTILAGAGHSYLSSVDWGPPRKPVDRIITWYRFRQLSRNSRSRRRGSHDARWNPCHCRRQVAGLTNDLGPFCPESGNRKKSRRQRTDLFQSSIVCFVLPPRR